MSILVFVEGDEGKIKKSSREAISYAAAMADGAEITALALGTYQTEELQSLGANGAHKVMHASSTQLDQGIIQAYAGVVAQAVEQSGAQTLILANSSLGDAIAARVSIMIDASLASNIVELPDTSNGFTVKRSIYTGKAFAYVNL
ncbi:MAG: electron transfer flavoprotein subunit alpha/FixB family protein, partial [Cyclobacteriaceae bacterium]|nr:electron transfer flavoprotein subunit alpha/FixB family protein [Cyclobacteriaceae bacterium]